jgi:Protein of unknown function (DUF3303)
VGSARQTAGNLMAAPFKEAGMLFAVTWVNRGDGSEDTDKRSLKLFTSWRPPAGAEFKAFYDYADASGGVALVEASSAEALLETMAPWATFFNFTCKPVVASEKSAEIYGKAIGWRDSVR